MSRWPMLLLVLCAAALGLAACGGDDGDDASVDTILADTFGKGKEVKSGRLDLSVKLDAKGVAQLSGPVTVRLSGPFQSSGGTDLPQFDFEAAIDATGQSVKAGAVSTGEKGFLTFQGQPYVLSDEMFKQFKDGYAQQSKCNAERDGGGSFSALGVSPRDWLQKTEKAGTEKVGGADTTHISGTIDVPKFLEDVNRILARADPEQQSADPCAEDAKDESSKSSGARQLTQEQRTQIAAAIKSAKVDIWTGAEDRTMRRMNVALKFDVPQAQRSGLGGLSSGDLSFDLTIGALNEKQTIKTPSGAKPLDELLGQLQGVTGTAGSSSGSGSGSQSGSAAGGSKYEQCIAGAGQDVQKLQDCADLIGQ